MLACESCLASARSNDNSDVLVVNFCVFVFWTSILSSWTTLAEIKYCFVFYVYFVQGLFRKK